MSMKWGDVRTRRSGLAGAAALAGVAMMAGCMSMATSGADAPARAAASTRDASSQPLGATPLIIDRSDLGIGTTVHFTRIPTATEMRDLLVFPALAHLVLSLSEWPIDYAALQVLNQVPEGPDVIVILPGYPPSSIATEAWNHVRAPIRLVLVVPGPPPNATILSDLNRMRHLERVIAEMDDPRRTGFEHLQRPLSFRTFVR